MNLQALAPATSTALPSTTATPIVDQALEPASVRHGSAAVQKDYQAALAFEQVLVEQLAKSLTATAGLGGEEEGEASGEGGSSNAASSELSATLPQTLSAGVMSAGGLGMAAQMTQQMQALEGSTASGAASSGGTAPTAVSTPTASAPATPVTSPSSGGTSA
jgi:Rod binding domain-containing protein